MMRRTLTVMAAVAMACAAAMACTSLMVGKKASADGSVMCTYNAEALIQ